MEHSKKYLYWLNSSNIDEETRAELESIADNETEIKHRFLKELEFGTAGLRGVLGAGTDRMNKYIVRKTTKGFAEYIKASGEKACERGVVIAHDNRSICGNFTPYLSNLQVLLLNFSGKSTSFFRKVGSQ